ncbi:EAL-associated domain-containing protein [Neobacillus sp. OS1-32]|jgi:EAL domain-containing protein (putative c-di-GMP-specific phosphodiesterase class I)|uniref:EAL domain-containing protein n=1 Tax=Neobacillus paridis TaxID=2803862 RepID=A0ABS1TMG6_9BACI|nr:MULTISPECIES: EAL-associated domain-containing protein [Neobacillus]MBL4952506.1 EAL domain-containing protein [Neobacillus paridis]WML31969.1 EAL-associated domain-containing protein [Neobacillus sp. OS1-32]
MDALEIVSNLENVFPYFQPIFSADEQLIIAYEVLGRYQSEDDIISLGPFFHDDQVPDEYKFEVDLLIVHKALEKALELDENISIFLNRNPQILMYENGEPFLEELLAFEKKGFQLKRIVLDISDRNYEGDFDQFDHLLQYYRTYGLKVALSGIERAGHFERIAQIEPDILKINLQLLKSKASGMNFNDVLFTISLLARKIGATLLFEYIEMSYQLQFAWKNGGQYYQGFYLHPPDAHFVARDLLSGRLKEKFHDFITYEKRKLEAVFFTAEFFQAKVQEIVTKNKKLGHEGLFQAIVKEMDEAAFRMYICDEDGFQKSANFFKGKNGWYMQEEYINKNWSWRPYFLENIIKMRNDRKGILSDLYCDIETGETIRTFSFPMSGTEYLFIDISYHYLFEHDQLL